MARSCSECKEKRPAHILCTYCNRWLCSSCTEEHRHAKDMADHFLSLAQKGSSGMDTGSSDSSLYCPLHGQEILKLFCETCDVLTCHSCLMIDHKDHRCRLVEEVLQNQRMLLESVTTQVEHKKTGLQASAKQIEDRLFEVKHLHRKVENQIKMAKMVLMNEVNKQANGLLEQLEGLTNERKQKLEQQLQSIMVLNRQFEHVQNFINWAVCSKNSIPFLFSKELIVFQMQRLLETSCNTDAGPPWKIRFTWEPSFWTKQLATLGQHESGHEPVLPPSLDIMHHKFELEEMQKDLELLLQAQQPSLQLNQTKSPQHVQQTIVGQINYIVRQPAPLQPVQEEVSQACEEPSVPEGPKPVPPLDRTVIPPLSQAMAEDAPASGHPLDSTMQPSSPNPVRKRSASVSIMGFSNTLEMELSSPRTGKSMEPQIQSVTSLTPSSCSHSMGPAPDTQQETVPSYSPAVTWVLHPGDGASHLSLGDVLLGNAPCKMENEDSRPISDSLGHNTAAACPSAQEELVLPLQKILEEPINLSVKKPLHLASPPVPAVSASPLPSTTVKPLWHTEDCGNSEQEPLEADMKENPNNRNCSKELKIPYVRLERLKICSAASGELPVFKLQREQDGTFLLVIECGAKSSSMSIKVNQDSLPDALKPKAEDPEERNVSVGFPAGPKLPLFGIASPGEQRSHCNPGAKKSPSAPNTDPIENEDFCAVCLNGGELLCCDHCPKVYHLSCHVPALLSFPGGEWVCTLCRSLTKPEVEYDCDNTRYGHTSPGGRLLPGLSEYDQKKCEKLVLSLCCSSLSLPFHEPVSPLARHYYQIIKRPMDLSIIRRKLQKKDIAHYLSPEEVVADVRLMFWNCAKFNYPDSEVAEAGRCLEVFFEGWLKEIYPERLFARPRQEDSDVEETEHESGGSVTPQGFPWPAYGQEYNQPKRRRRHTENERAKRLSFRLASSFPQV
ncbi:tripartite motif-containing protein 66 isoform X3 [Notamacropus eugenii]|uniref:tripartite motif-containing protein 66 isoform X3 n=1 Tax=Notamacropus eugenii TaxID=9315 RepID=UPI003B675126